jgi:hypothetical protein
VPILLVGFTVSSTLLSMSYRHSITLSSPSVPQWSTVARIALAWVQAQPGVTSTIIGARRLAQLEDAPPSPFVVGKGDKIY